MSTPSPLRLLRREPAGAEPAGGRRVVLVHGSMDRASSFARLMNRLPDWSIVSYDRRGYAGSSGADPAGGFGPQVADLVEVLGEQPAVVFGHSYGGIVALAAAAVHPALIPGAVVWEPPQPWLTGWPPARAPGAPRSPADRAEWFMRRMIGDRVWERLPERTRAQRRAEGATLEAEIATLAGPAPFSPNAVRIPVIVGRGGRSPTPQRRAAADLAAALPGAELADVADAGHGAHLSHPAELAGLIRLVASRV